MNRKEKLELYYKAKEAYYNGQEIMTDLEFDTLEKELGLENKSEVGTKHNPSYTVKHPIIMGSLSKVQIHEKDGKVDWKQYHYEVAQYFDDYISQHVIITPKFDGCSFECEIENNIIKQISSRGDGKWGKDLTQHLAIFIPDEYVNLPGHFILRGEVLIKKSIFEKKYSEEFVNPRSFVSGILNRDYDRFDTDFQSKLMDLSIVIYDYRVDYYGTWKDEEWTNLPLTNVLPKKFYNDTSIYSTDEFSIIYREFENYRSICEYALDGIVIKPIEAYRINNTTETRPKDCVAIKFIPMLQQTEITNITWNIGKTGEYIPIIWVKPIEMDGKIIQKCSGHNYGYLRDNNIGIGTIITMSLAGDIIPFLYKVISTDINCIIPIPKEGEYFIDGVHMKAILTEEDSARLSFVSSSTSLNIPNIGRESAKKIFDYLCGENDETADFFGIERKELIHNILECNPEDIYFGLGGGKLGSNAKKSFEELIKNITLKDIIVSCNFKLCGGKIAEACVDYLLNGDADFSHLAKEGYEWVLKGNENYPERVILDNLLNKLGRTFEDFKIQYKEIKEEKSEQIPIIMTGEPNDYKSKGEFLKCHPEYRNTGSWKEVKIVFTNSMDSNTGKMKKAKEKGIEIRLY